MVYLPRKISKIRLKEAQNARNNRAEIVTALSQGQITRRDLFKWGLLTTTGLIAAKHGLSPFVKSAYAGFDVPTGTPPSPLFGAEPFTQKMPRLNLQVPQKLNKVINPSTQEIEAAFPASSSQPNAKRLSFHTDFNDSGGNSFANPLTGIGPMEGRPFGEYFAHQRWSEFTPEQAYVMTIGQIEANTRFHPAMPAQAPNAVWAFNSGRFSEAVLPPPLIKVRYGEPVVTRIYNNLPQSRAENGGFGRNEFAIHNHNAHNASASDGASNAHIFPGQFYDYHWGTTLARHDIINTDASDPRASGPDGNGGLNHIRGDFRELQSTLWYHDHRFFFTAENVYKGMAGMLNYYSGPDRGHEELDDGVNHRLPSGTRLDWGNIDFDVNLIIADMAFDQQGQYFFDIFETDGFVGDLLHVNFAYSPYFEVLPRKYRFRILNACMSRWLKLALADEDGNKVPFQFIANDGNFVLNPIDLAKLDTQGSAERYDIVVDFSRFQVGDGIKLVNLMEHKDGRRTEGPVGLRKALRGRSEDPAVGPVMEFRVVDEVESVDEPGHIYRSATHVDRSHVPFKLTEQIPIVAPVRERHIKFNKGGIDLDKPDGDDPRDNFTGDCIPDCGDRESFPWTIEVNGEKAHSLNANRSSLLVPKPGEIEHWTIENSSGGWEHPIHLHFEEGVTISRNGKRPRKTENLVRKDVWRLHRNDEVTFQVQFGEYGGAYVNHCHNTVHEDNAMLMRYDILTEEGGPGSQTHVAIIPTPNPHPEGVTYLTPEILPEGDPRISEGTDLASDNSGSSNGDDGDDGEG